MPLIRSGGTGVKWDTASALCW